MDLDLTKSQEMIRQMVRDFAVKEVAPGAAQRDASGEFPVESIPHLAKYNLSAIN